jgi:transcriptional regulator of aromatic amino acid metabolism
VVVAIRQFAGISRVNAAVVGVVSLLPKHQEHLVVAGLEAALHQSVGVGNLEGSLHLAEGAALLVLARKALEVSGDLPAAWVVLSPAVALVAEVDVANQRLHETAYA